MTLSPNTKRHLISGAITFSTGFLLAVLPILDTITIDQFDRGIFFGLILAGLRAGLKLVVEKFLLPKE